MQIGTRRCAIAVVAIVWVGGCGGEMEEAPPPTPRVKVAVVGQSISGVSRQLSGRLEAINRSALAFGVPGTVVEVLVNEGDAVEAGAVLARLDGKPFEARARAAGSRLDAARAELKERLANLARGEALLAQDVTPVAEVERLRAHVEQARGRVKAAESEKVNIDKELEQTRILAPMAGRITKRSVEPFQEVTPNEVLFQFAGEGGLKVVIQVPGDLVRKVSYGQPAAVQIPSLESRAIPARVSEIAAAASEGTAFRVALELDETETSKLDLRPGIAAKVTLGFTGAFENGDGAFRIPLSALALEEMVIDEDRPEKTASVFVYDPESGTVRERQVLGTVAVMNDIVITEGLRLGDRVVVSGVAFLHDGMAVELWEPPE